MTADNNTGIDGSSPSVSAAPKAKTSYRCSFCGKDQTEVLLLVAGPDVFICNECVAKAHEIVEDVKAEKATNLQQPE